MNTYLHYLVLSHHVGEPRGITSVCSAHPTVIEATLRYAGENRLPALIEATCNQVNQFGGYTGMTPLDFANYVKNLAQTLNFPPSKLILGGDHLGPLVWADEPSVQAMAKAKTLVRDFALAGFQKLHLDCSMPLGDDKELSLSTIAQRTAELAAIVETTCSEHDLPKPCYVIGSEVPPAGGAKAGELHIKVTDTDTVAETIELTRQAFYAFGLHSAWERVIALVVQPGVEFGDSEIHEYNRQAATPLTKFIETVPGIIFEAHSTDYQTREALRTMVEDHFAILKVGPALTYAFREGIFALAEIENQICDSPSHIKETLERAMLTNPKYWQKYYHGDERTLRRSLFFSFSDRIRYYWTEPSVHSALTQLFSNLANAPLPLTLLSQYLPKQYSKIRAGLLKNNAHNIVLDKITEILEDYNAACYNAGTGT